MAQSSNDTFPSAMCIAAARRKRRHQHQRALDTFVDLLQIRLGAALKLGFVSEGEFDRVVDPRKMVKPYVAGSAGH